jgi:nucleoid-associated protein YgaU
MLKEKYQSVLDLAGTLGIQSLDAQEQNNKLTIKGTATYQLAKDTLWDQIKTIGGWENDLVADITVAKSDIYGVYSVQPGDTLSKIAKSFFGASNKYMAIYNANKDVLTNPDVIKVGQQLKIPNV